MRCNRRFIGVGRQLMEKRFLSSNQETFGKKTLWQSVYQLEAISKKLGKRDTEEVANYVMQSCLFLWRTGKCNTSQFSARALQGKGQSSGKGTVDVLLLKHGFLNKLLGMIHMSSCTEGQKATLKKALLNWDGYIQHFQPEEQNPNVGWQASLPEGIRPLMEFIEKLVYDTKYDSKVCGSSGRR